MPYPGAWPSLQPLRLVVEAGRRARCPGRSDTRCTCTLPPGEQVRVAMSSTLDAAIARQVRAVALAPGQRRRPRRRLHHRRGRRRRGPDACGVVGLDLVADARRPTCASCTPCRRRCGPRSCSALSLFLRPPGRSVAAFTGLVDVHGSSTDTVVVRASWTETVDDVDGVGAAGGVEVRRRRPLARRASARRPACCSSSTSCRPVRSRRRSAGSGSTGCCRRSRTPTTGASPTCPAGRRGTPSSSRPSQLPGEPVDRRAGGARHPVVGPSGGARSCSTPCRCCAGRRRRSPTTRSRGGRSAARACASGWRGRGSRPATASCSASWCSTPTSGCQAATRTGSWTRQPKAHAGARRRDEPVGARTRSCSTAGRRSNPTVPPLLTFDQLVLDVVETVPPRASGSGRRSHGEVYRRARPRLARRPGQPGRRRRGGAAAGRARASRGPGPGLPAGVRRGHRALVRRRRAARDAGAVAVRAARRRPLPAAVDRGLLALAGRADRAGCSRCRPARSP